jgi:hypothetical protein
VLIAQLAAGDDGGDRRDLPNRHRVVAAHLRERVAFGQRLGRVGVSFASACGLLTLRWREMDSNFRFREGVTLCWHSGESCSVKNIAC